MCDIWKIREARQLTPEDLEKQLATFRELGVRWVVLTGGEPQMSSHLPELAQMLRSEGVRVTLLTAGLLLESQAAVIAGAVDDLIVSLDGPPTVHDLVRRIPQAFARMAAGVGAVRQFRGDMTVCARCTVQKANHLSLRETIQSAKGIGLNSISFLAADVSSAAFNRAQGWSPERQEAVALNAAEVDALDKEVERIITEHASEIASGFVVESASKLRRIVSHFRAHLGQVQHVAPCCNAPWVSAVIEASGDVRPCFFHPAFGNIHRQALNEILNGPGALSFRAELDIESNPVCRQCVCSLHIPSNSE